MGRPREIELLNGNITLTGFSTEEADRLEQLLLTEAVKETRLEPKEVVSGTLAGTAIGLHVDSNSKTYTVSTIKFDPETKAAHVVENMVVEGGLRAAQTAVKTQMFKLNVV